jgi:hypothetical protein
MRDLEVLSDDFWWRSRLFRVSGANHFCGAGHHFTYRIPFLAVLLSYLGPEVYLNSGVMLRHSIVSASRFEPGDRVVCASPG